MTKASESLNASPSVERLHRERIGAAIRRQRERKGWSQQWLADQIGRTQAWLSRIETGDRWFSSAGEMVAILALCDLALPWEEARWPVQSGGDHRA